MRVECAEEGVDCAEDVKMGLSVHKRVVKRKWSRDHLAGLVPDLRDHYIFQSTWVDFKNNWCSQLEWTKMPQKGGKLSCLIALMCTTRCRILVSASTNQWRFDPAL